MTTDITKQTFSNRDEFQRKNIAENIIKLLKSEINISPMVIDGGWGTGKSEFCHKLINFSKDQGDDYHHVYIDAYRADHADEPLLTVLAAVLNLIPNEAERQTAIKKVIPALRYGLKAAGKAAVSHLLRQDAADVADEIAKEIAKEISKAAGKAIDASVEGLLKDHVEADKNLKLLQDSLTEISSEKPILIFVDELDRCRPNFSVNMLEVIKHTFNVKNVQFVLITNTQQLKAAVNHTYGSDVDAQRYLDKFLKYTLLLSSKVNYRGDSEFQTSLLYYFKLIDESHLLEGIGLNRNIEGDLVRHLIKIHKWSLREVESLVRSLEIFQVLTNSSGLHQSKKNFLRAVSILGVTLSVFKPRLGQSMIDGRADSQELGDFLEVPTVPVNAKPRPAFYQIMAVAFGQECHINSKNLTPSENVEAWEDLLDNLFHDQWETPEKGSRSVFLTEVFEILAFK